MKTYNHSNKAGNLADVWKHFVLTELLQSLSQSKKRFVYVESHCGAPLHELFEGGAWQEGLGVVAKRLPKNVLYAKLARECLAKKSYLASWQFASAALQTQERTVVLHDISKEVATSFEKLKKESFLKDVSFRQTDGYAGVMNMQESDLVFLDPPFMNKGAKDWQELAKVCAHLNAQERAFVLWYPLFEKNAQDAFVQDLGCKAYELYWSKSAGMLGCGMMLSETLTPFLKEKEALFKKVALVMGATLA